MKILICLLISVTVIISEGYSADSSLEEMLYRKERLSSATWGNDYLESSTNNYTWQAETLNYTDSTTNHEVWVLVRQPDRQDIYSKEHGSSVWSCDGSRLGFYDFSTRKTRNPAIRNDRSSMRWIVNADGSGLRATEGYGKYSIGFDGFSWASTELAYYSFGSNPVIDAPYYSLCKMTLNEQNIVTGNIIMDTSTIDNSEKRIVKDGIGNSDENIVFRSMSTQPRSGCANRDSTSVYFAALDPSVITSHWQVSRNIDDYTGHDAVTSEDHFHDVWAPGSRGDMIIGDYSGTSDIFVKFKAAGSCATAESSEPIYEHWDGDSFGKNEVMVISDGGDEINNPYGLPYFGHPTFDRWGKYALVGTYTDVPAPGTRIVDMDTLSMLSNYPLAKGKYDGQHHSWTGWTDYVVGVDPVDMIIYANKYTNDANSARKVIDTHHPGLMVKNYNGYPRPSQSPDGTKIAFAANWLNNDDDSYPYINWAVAYYPYPPEIISCAATGGKVTLRFDWRTDQKNSRGYTQRGWPNEATDDPPPPRETKLFRLWRSADKSSWIPIKTVNADIFTRYNFSEGTWKSAKYWELNDEPGDGQWYYAVTALEWSGLESHTLSNIYSITLSSGSGTGSSVAGYPSEPGGDGKFYSSYKETHKLTRYYNIYAEDGARPAISQANRIASVSINADRIYIDWLGKSDGSTEYLVTAVDYQGNESAAILPTRQVNKPAAGMYTLAWAALGEATRFTIPTGLKPGN